MTRPPALHRDLMRYLHRAALLSERAGDRRFHQRIGIGRTLFLVLRSIADAGDVPPSQQEIADLLSLTKGAVSRHVETAQRRGWLAVTASAASRREHALTLTTAGRSLVQEGSAVQHEYERVGDEHVTEAAMATTIRTLKTICELLENEERR
ncbi:MarR family winged helix-turn-helix transcriptional regulator [Amycolatopsis sp. cmx-4-68]|uniref:MarR family winged helix-turn-helix transcriptional regulator n=1 Tax=Amycolatopsis sp. cmx-4-68 TaxID=2790938 RepID=UPI00397D0EE6